MAFCGNCGSSVSGHAFCPNCGTQVGVAQVTTPTASVAVEQTLLNEAGVFISTSRFISNGQTYAMSGVTSVGSGTEYPSKIGPLLMILFGAFLALCGLGLLFITKGGLVLILLGAGIVALGVASWKKKVPIYTVLLRSASGEQRATSSASQDFVRSIISALNQAIVLRG